MRYYRCTNQYSITALTESLGTIKERYTYDAYGGLSVFDGSGTARTSTAESNRYTYTGREWDEDLDLYHYRARMYDPVAGRFLGRDPIGYEGSKWGLYGYVQQAPLSMVDPSGQQGTLLPPSSAPPPGQGYVPPYVVVPPKPILLPEADWPKMVCNYYEDNPRPVIIKPDSPLHKKIFGSPSFAKCRAKAKEEAGNISSGMGSGLGCWESESKSGSTSCIVDHTDEFFALGKSYVKVSIDCTSIGACLPCDDNVIPSTSCKIKYTIRDSFEDPLNIGLEPGGTPYPIDGDFDEDWGGCPFVTRSVR